MSNKDQKYPVTPDGRYFVVRGRLWRCSNPALPQIVRDELIRELMAARRAKKTALRSGDTAARELARKQVDEAKRKLGERGEVWWSDGSPDLNRQMIKNTIYSHWFAQITGESNAAAKEPLP